ncbi:hypothetical protein RPD_2757 [Rhodopseudomonas palustris BisB5]|uniref:Uncharacterized protein n=1 Tax=Rhodopseudomonas palustris (strain BisB5) TaxID=316057 RepID=Q136K4_RHOPS|nr:hypothetical protein RPD_2757 [Rhodopseudomonas palustris BisB5]
MRLGVRANRLNRVHGHFAATIADRGGTALGATALMVAAVNNRLMAVSRLWKSLAVLPMFQPQLPLASARMIRRRRRNLRVFASGHPAWTK